MDEELRSFLAERFEAVDRQFDGVQRQFGELRGEVGELRGEVGELRDRVVGVERQVDDLRGDVRGLQDRVEEVRRESGVIGEGLRGEIRLIAEGHIVLREWFGEQLDGFRRDNDSQHRDIQAMIKFSHTDLDRRVTRLEAFAVGAEARLSRLEGAA